MSGLKFELAQREHAEAIGEMRREATAALVRDLGPGNWSGSGKLPAIRERIANADPENLRRSTLYVATREGEPVGSVVVSTFPPGFWKRQYWRQGKAPALGVFTLVVFPEFQRQGIGKFLMDSVEHLAAEHEIPFVRLDAYLVNPFSVAFYRAIGYDERATIDLRGTGLILFEKQVAEPKTDN